MANLIAPIILSVLVLALLVWMLINPPAIGNLREALFRNIGVPYRNLIGLLLGVAASLLPLTSGTWTISAATWIFIVAISVTMFLLIKVEPNKELDRFSWGLLVVILLGFGLGALIYQSRSWWIWLWNKYRLINEPHELVLESLFLLGVMMGVFVVRNWAKEQKAFQDSLAGILSGTFVAAVLGDVLKGLTPLQSLAYYALGFTMSGTFNLLLAGRLTANYTNKRSMTSRAVLDFLYGNERAKVIDGYFLKNFEEDPDYAKRFMKDALLNFCALVQREFAERIDEQMKKRLRERDPDIAIKCATLTAAENERKRLKAAIDGLPAQLDQTQTVDKQEIEALIEEIDKSVSVLRSRLRPSFCYQLFAIECGEKRGADTPASAVQDMDRRYSVIYKHIDETTVIDESMFRVGVAFRKKDVLEYIVAPGPYLGSFPYVGSVAGLSLIVRQTIIMDRDRTKQFRSKDYRDGICPRDTEQWRGLDEIDYLSYISMPVVARLGRSDENPLGVINLDTKLFVTYCPLDDEPVESSDGMFRTRLTPRELNEFGSHLYEQDDEAVRYLEKLSKIIEPILELYSKCQVGAI